MLKTCLLTTALCGVLGMSGWPWNWWHRPEDKLARLNLWQMWAADEFQKGTERFQQGREALREPAKARQAFLEAMVAFEYCGRFAKNASAYKNLGNSAYLADDLPQAIVAFHAATRVAPNDRVARESLDFVRGKVEYPEGRGRPVASSWPPWLPRPTLQFCRTVTLVAYALLWVAGTRWFMTRRRPWLTRAVASVVVCLAAGVGWWLCDRAERFHHQHPLVVIAANDVPLLTGNGISYSRHATLPTLSRGMEARRLHQRGDWLHIQFAGGEVGWVQRQQVLVDEP